MGKIVAVMGNSGVGKTTLAQLLCEQGGYASGIERNAERPFQALFAADLQRYGLPNQMDFLLVRAEQEIAMRRDERDGILDGGLEQDFAVFARLFHQRGYLSRAEFELCERLFQALRCLLPPPDLVIWLAAPPETIAARYTRRDRALEISRKEDLGAIQILLDEWLATWKGPLIQVDVSEDDPSYAGVLPGLLEQMRAALHR
jgi:deoxyadenosine/deoxycytidine kinase